MRFYFECLESDLFLPSLNLGLGFEGLELGMFSLSLNLRSGFEDLDSDLFSLSSSVSVSPKVKAREKIRSRTLKSSIYSISNLKYL